LANNDAIVQVPADGAGKQIDHSLATTSSGTVYRQRAVLASDAGPLVCVSLDGEISVKSRSERKTALLDRLGVTKRRNKIFGR
jgi:hypothetical protein